jgi:uncharacterized protein (TIGR03437 family)
MIPSGLSYRSCSLACLAIQIAAGQPAGTVVQTGAMVEARYAQTATLLRDGRVLLSGGIVATLQGGGLTSQYQSSAEIFDPSTSAFSRTGDMAHERVGHTATLLEDGRVLIVGGFGQDFVDLTITCDAELYDPVQGGFRVAGELPDCYGENTAVLLNDGRVLIVGDSTAAPDSTLASTATLYDPVSGQFSFLGAVPIALSVATLLPDGRVFLAGGGSGLALIYDPATGSFDPTGGPAPNSNPLQLAPTFAATLLANGSVLLVEGYSLNPNHISGAAELYDPATGTFQQTGPMQVANGTGGDPVAPMAVTLPGGRVVVDNGTDVSAVLALYDQTTGTFHPFGPEAFPAGTSTLLMDGSVLIAGALPGASTATADLYLADPMAASSASLTAPLAPGSSASIFGARLVASTASAADAQSPPLILGGIGVSVRDGSGAEWPAPLLYVSPSQINFEVPPGVLPGNVIVEILNGASTVSVAAQVSAIAPGLFTIPGNIAAAYGTRIEADGSQTILPAGAPITLDDRPVYLSLFGTGIRGLSSQNNVTVSISGIDAPVSYAGPQDTIPCLDQVNVLLAAALKGAGNVPLVLTVDGVAANKVIVDFK